MHSANNALNNSKYLLIQNMKANKIQKLKHKENMNWKLNNKGVKVFQTLIYNNKNTNYFNYIWREKQFHVNGKWVKRKKTQRKMKNK